MKFSNIEKKHLAKAWIAISLAFGIVLAGGFRGIMSENIFSMFIIAALTVGIGFLAHEIAHKYVAQKYHCYAEFRSFDNMLLLAIAMSFFGFVFAAPGAVMIRGVVTKERNGKISIAGPLTNIILAALFAILLILTPFKLIAGYGLLINSWLALFNMIPFGNLDGAKVLRWNKVAYGFTVAAAVILMMLSSKIMF
jgi:Zn-dependent protease